MLPTCRRIGEYTDENHKTRGSLIYKRKLGRLSVRHRAVPLDQMRQGSIGLDQHLRILYLFQQRCSGTGAQTVHIDIYDGQ